MSRVQEDGKVMLHAAEGSSPYSERIPLSPYQRDIWVAALQFPELDQYTLFGYERFRGRVDEAALKEALVTSARHADAFALRIGEDAGALYQWRDKQASPRLAEVDFSRETDPDAALEAWLQNSFHFHYPLDGSPLADLYLLRTPDAVIAYMRAHHVVCDAWGLRLFLERARAEYLRITTGREYESDASSFVEAMALDQYVSSDEYRAGQAYFSEALADAEQVLFARKRPNGARPTARHTFHLERSLIEQMRDRGHSPFLLLSASIALYLARVHRSDEVVIGIPLMN